MIKVDGIKLAITESEDLLKIKACKKANVNINKIKYFNILKKSLDARNKANLKYVYSVEMDYDCPKEEKEVYKNYNYPKNKTVIVGSGPSGLFCALYLARRGFNPLVIERGKNVDERKQSIEKFYTEKTLDVNSNVQFGEGGAGTFSDGKLNTGVKSEHKNTILNEFILHGAPKEIAYDNKPHIGSDKLPLVIKGIREEIISLGGAFMFSTLMTDIKVEDGKVTGVFIKDLTTQKEDFIQAENVILAIGHSARDTYYALYNKGVYSEAKDIAVGVRIEHLSEDINRVQYGKNNLNKGLPTADYKLTSNVNGRGVFTFCMCPGGYVVGASSEEKGVVVNGMSNYARDNVNSNSAVVVQVRKEDFGSDPIKGIEYLRELERKAYNESGDYKAPVQLFGDFLKGKQSKSFGKVKPTYPIGTVFARLDKLLPNYIVECLKGAILDMDKRLRGFALPDAVLTGVETRTSSPMRFTRDEDLMSVNVKNLYPVGETGYAGGIMSAAIDGIKTATLIAKRYER